MKLKDKITEHLNGVLNHKETVEKYVPVIQQLIKELGLYGENYYQDEPNIRVYGGKVVATGELEVKIGESTYSATVKITGKLGHKLPVPKSQKYLLSIEKYPSIIQALAKALQDDGWEILCVTPCEMCDTADDCGYCTKSELRDFYAVKDGVEICWKESE